jgi:hypothetical protein
VHFKESSAVMIFEDGNDLEHARQEIPYTDFPLNSIYIINQGISPTQNML